MEKYPKVAIIYLSFHSEPYIDDVISGLKRLTYPKDKVEFVVVDNPHPEFGLSMRMFKERLEPLSDKEIPHTTLLPQEKNLGFAGGNNEGIKWAIENGFDYVYFHNSDGFIAADFLESLVETMEKDKTVGEAQSLILLYPESNLVNTSGNVFQYLGFGYCKDYKKEAKEIEDKISEINYASGAGVLMRVDLLKEFGVWDEDFFMYHEDLEYSLRLRMAGYKIIMVPRSIFYHKYQFGRSITKFYWMERNRYGVMLMFFKLPTLLLFLPMLVAVECGLWILAFKNGYIKERVKVYKYWLNYKNWQIWLKKRKYIQSIRKIKDRDLLINAGTGIDFQEKSMENPLIKNVGNPIMKIYHSLVVKNLLKW